MAAILKRSAENSMAETPGDDEAPMDAAAMFDIVMG
jgi:hypothetical protein